LQSLNTLFKAVSTTAFLSEFTFTDKFSSFHNWHAVYYRHYVIFCDIAIVIEVVDLKHKFNFFVKRWAVEADEPHVKLVFV
jgi:hypothetical protein